MVHQPEIIKKDLLALTPSVFATKWYFDTIPFIFEDQYDQYVEWRHNLAAKMNIDPSDIIITGSAGLGISLNPHKNFKKYDSRSDIDICIFSEYYFSVAWHDLLQLSLVGLNPRMNAAVKDHRNRYIYWGTIATDQILPLLSFGSQWGRIIPQLSKYDAMQDHDINFRIYRDRQSFRRYLLTSIEDRRTVLLEANCNE